MEIGLGLPISDPARLPEWARLAEEHRFATLALLDRLAYDNPEPLTALAVLAGVTSRIRLQTEVLLGPLRSTALLAKQVATLDRMSAGRFVLGIGIGGREDDHAAAGVPITRRGRILDAQLADLRKIWNGEPYREAHPAGMTPSMTAPGAIDGVTSLTMASGVVDGVTPLTTVSGVVDGVTSLTTASGVVDGVTPSMTASSVIDGVTPSTTTPGEVDAERPSKMTPGVIASEACIGPKPITAGGPPILIGGFAPEALRRIARFADGFICAAPLAWAGGLVRTVNEQWDEAGRTGRPRLVCQINVAVGSPGTIERGRRAVADYYAFTGRPGWGAPLTDPVQIADTVAAYREFGADELIMYCYADDPHQVELLAEFVH
ncbi:LLM class flavin-dependent oxidoreductase [Actinoplanes regularis]|uniref:Luciferase-like monooxygenase n=1 Tax=Actinoplanes regularis TaxID=52697 RepID=A0A239BLH0_9ACTN|nr:LLM class flavin-dependent oxidoreductase [Actinoplanes regularis]GIE88051.1 hypothetical protein Are01nite_45310 [Actinoplanes regularis]SNS07893.1 Luciferase-like monooxygenase [Actinoplanes regularis]